MSQEQTIFKQGSTTFFISSLFFPRDIKKDVFDLYSFVRVADDYVDRLPIPDKDSFYHLRRLWSAAIADSNFDMTKQAADSIDEMVIKNMLRVAHKNNFEMAWIESFLDAMQSDLTHKPYQTVGDTQHYVYGSGEVIGLMMAKIMGLKPEAAEAARLQGRALQFMNFIRDVQEDNDLGRSYFPANELKQFNLPNLTRQTATKQTKDFTKFMHFQLDRYEMWHAKAREGYKYIPKRLRVPLRTAADMYTWTAQEVRKNPLVIYEKKVKPSKVRIVRTLFANSIKISLS
jgi:phytoene synthase